MTRRLATPDDVERALEDSALLVPEVAPAEHGMDWLRSRASRFANGAVHAERRRLVVEALAGLDPAALRRAARTRADAILDTGPSPAEIAARVPVEVLVEALGVNVDVDAVVAVAAAYPLAAPPERRAAGDAAVERLRAAGADDDLVPALTILAQASVGTAGLILNALARGGGHGDAGALVGDTLRDDPPVRETVRVDGGETVVLDLAAAGLPFGAGPRACPGAEHAAAIAAGVVEAVLAA